MSTLADRIKLALEENKQTQRALAAAAGVKPPSVSDWVSGKTKSLKGDSLVEAAKFLRVNTLWLSKGIGPMRPTRGQASVHTAQETPGEYQVWPFKRVTRARLAALSAEALADIEDHLELVVTKWEGRAKPAHTKRAAA